uniref:Uncharacterized protein LOC104234195 n=1 Tax=Nicotiana sylvestris TaxID=4096 RepID=A0A1U7XGG8_NICSY|nr:PREDICTED: uncharacterized protein LOC104234195 [Nicotiana sylvestris]
MRSLTISSTENYPMIPRYPGRCALKQLDTTSREVNCIEDLSKACWPDVWDLGASKSNYVMREVQEGICKNHAGAGSLVLKVIRAGFYWLRMEQDTKAYVQKYDKCQRHAPLWVEACPYQKISERKVVDFLWENIICRFGIPKEIACDNMPQFKGAKVAKFLEDLKIKRIISSPYYSSANEQAESTNKVIIQKSQKEIGRSQRQMVRRATGSVMGIPIEFILNARIIERHIESEIDEKRDRWKSRPEATILVGIGKPSKGMLLMKANECLSPNSIQ